MITDKDWNERNTYGVKRTVTTTQVTSGKGGFPSTRTVTKVRWEAIACGEVFATRKAARARAALVKVSGYTMKDPWARPSTKGLFIKDVLMDPTSESLWYDSNGNPHFVRRGTIDGKYTAVYCPCDFTGSVRNQLYLSTEDKVQFRREDRKKDL